MDIKCEVEGCEFLTHRKNPAHCSKHHWRYQKHGSTDLPERKNKRTHPLYSLWYERRGILCEPWTDFWVFAEAVSPKPEGNYFLLRLTSDAPFGPDNFKWQEHLKRKEGESKKDWWARKWQARHSGNRNLERRRGLMRRFGITVQQYEDMLAQQNNVCAICKMPERAVDGKTGGIKNLAVDHCHATGKVRGLLCWDCNTCLGKAKESTEVLQEMISYLRKHE